MMILKTQGAISRQRRAAPQHSVVHNDRSTVAESSTAARDVVINGATFRSSGAPLVHRGKSNSPNAGLIVSSRSSHKLHQLPSQPKTQKVAVAVWLQCLWMLV